MGASDNFFREITVFLEGASGGCSTPSVLWVPVDALQMLFPEGHWLSICGASVGHLEGMSRCLSLSHISEESPGWRPSQASCTMTTTEMIRQRFKKPSDVPAPTMPPDFYLPAGDQGKCDWGISRHKLRPRGSCVLISGFYGPKLNFPILDGQMSINP